MTDNRRNRSSIVIDNICLNKYYACMSKAVRAKTEPDGTSCNVKENIPTSEYNQEESVIYLMRRALNLCTREIDRQLEPKELTSAQWAPLLKLYMGYASTVGELARECEQDAGAMTRLLDRLEVKGLCQRRRSEQDRRTVYIELTKRGREVASDIPSVLGCVQNAQMVGFSGEEVDTLKGLLRRIIHNGQQ